MEIDELEQPSGHAVESGSTNSEAESIKPMNCVDFQRDLPLIIDTGGNAEQEEHLRTCPVCGDLVADLRYIAEQAKLLIPMRDPSPKVWSNIEDRLKREGLVKSAQGRRG